MNSHNATYPLISIIVPIYNASMYLERCFRCLYGQSYSNLEFVLIDDGSTDGSGDMCDMMIAKDNRFKVFHVANGGASLARKLGLEQAAGEFVSFIDSDDYITDDYIKQLYALRTLYQTNISACRVQRVRREECKPQATEQSSTILAFEQLMPRFFRYEFWGLYGKLYKRDIFDNITFPTATISEDYLVTMQLLLQERQMAYTDAPLYFYEYHEDGLSHLKLSKRAFEEFDNVKAVYELAQTQAPQYSAMALSNVVETCIKLLSMAHQDRARNFDANAAPLRQFLKTHLWEILRSRAVYWKLKVMVMLLLTKPLQP